MFSKRKIIARLLLICSAASLAVHAQEPTGPIGYVMTVKGEATVSNSGKSVQAVVGTPVLVGTELKTGPASSMGITLKDNTVMSFGPNTHTTLDEFLFTPAQGELKLTTKITRGTMNFISGVIAKLKPEAVTVNTPTGTIGVRGTHFLVKVEE
ncbi:MAG: hypothetical protein JWQ23_2143 [Herminiimonas sp.]|jgi:hypothetical protein|nr:hypothetical protein [Herminiimonas sp.]